MKNYILLLIIIVLIAAACLQAQIISNIDFGRIRAANTDSTSLYYYKLLLNRFEQFDTLFTDDELQHLYYGTVFDASYDPMQTDWLKKSDEYEALISKGKYKQALKIVLPFVANDPTNIKYNSFAFKCYYKCGDNSLAKKYLTRAIQLVLTIRRSGNGSAPGTAFVVTRVSDEYQVLSSMGLTVLEHSSLVDTPSVGLHTDLFVLNPNDRKIDTLYYNDTWAYNYLCKTIDGVLIQNK
jgi:tetratricopeptide (TPR) repeat protein